MNELNHTLSSAMRENIEQWDLTGWWLIQKRLNQW